MYFGGVFDSDSETIYVSGDDINGGSFIFAATAPLGFFSQPLSTVGQTVQNSPEIPQTVNSTPYDDLGGFDTFFSATEQGNDNEPETSDFLL